MRPTIRAIALTAGVALAIAACGSGAGSASPAAPSSAPNALTSDAPSPGATLSGKLVIYSGREEELIAGFIDTFRATSGIDVQVKYGSTSELAATILEEGDASPADLFLAQDAGALGAVAAEGRLAPLPTATLDRVEARFRSDAGVWVGVSGRARVAAYDTRVLTPADLPTSIMDFVDPKWRGRLAWAPTNGSFQSFVTALRILRGDEAAKAWLEGIQANQPKVFESNNAILAAIAAGEAEVGFVNHYYVLRQIAEQGESYPVRNFWFDAADPGALINVAGIGILTTAPNPTAAQAFLDAALSTEGQRYFSAGESEYPLVPEVDPPAGLTPLDQLGSPDIDLSDLSDLKGTLRIMQEAGVL